MTDPYIHKLVHFDAVKCDWQPFDGTPYSSCTGEKRKNKRPCESFVPPDSCNHLSMDNQTKMDRKMRKKKEVEKVIE